MQFDGLSGMRAQYDMDPSDLRAAVMLLIGQHASQACCGGLVAPVFLSRGWGSNACCLVSVTVTQDVCHSVLQKMWLSHSVATSVCVRPFHRCRVQ